MSTALAVAANASLTSSPARVQLGGAMAMQQTIEDLDTIRKFVAGAMIKDVDYGVIPGTGSKATLYLPGAQKTLMYFNCYPEYEVEPRELERGHVEYIVKTLLKSRMSQNPTGSGIGSCSTMESKYRWRKAGRVCPKCGVEAIIKGKAEYGGGFICFARKDGCGAKFSDSDPEITSQSTGRAENPDIYDARNTVLKMAKKRSLVDSALGLGCMSELFTQDLEDNVPEHHDDRPARDEPSRDPMPSREPQGSRRPQGRNSNRAPSPTPPKWAAYLQNEVIRANQDWDLEFARETGKNPEEHPEFTSTKNAANAICTSAIEEGLISHADVAKADKPDARDPQKAAAALTKLFAEKSDAVHTLVANYLKSKRQRKRAEFGMIDPEEPDDDPGSVDTAGQDAAETVSQEVPESVTKGREPGDDDEK